MAEDLLRPRDGIDPDPVVAAVRRDELVAAGGVDQDDRQGTEQLHHRPVVPTEHRVRIVLASR